jgi:hypothetical protein
MSYDDQKLNEANISNEYATPGVTQLGTLATLKLLAQMSEIAEQDTFVGKTTREEIKYLEAAMGAISSNPGLASKFGSGFDGVQELAAIIKARQSQRVFEDVLNDVFKQANKSGGKSTVGQFDLAENKRKLNYSSIE